MPDVRCILCRVALSPENDSAEHVVLNAIGGRLKVRHFMCRDCNSGSGESWDAALAAQLNPLCVLIGVVRERGTPPPVNVDTTAGENLRVHADGSLTLAKPIFEKRETGDEVAVSLVARSQKEARSILGSLKRKHPTLNVEAILAQAKNETTLPAGMIRLQLGIGGEDAGRSIVKTALAFAHYAGLDLNEGNAANYLRDVAAEPPFGYYYERDLIVGREPTVPLHCVAVAADPLTGLALGYVEYFGIHRVVVCLSRSYCGPALAQSHAVDPRTGKKLDLAVDMAGIDADDLSRIYDYQTLPDEAVIAAYKSILGEAVRRKQERTREQYLLEAVDHAFATCGAQEGDILTEEHLRRISFVFARRMAEFFVRTRAQIAQGAPAFEDVAACEGQS